MAEALRLQACQTIVPAKATEPGLKHPIKVTGPFSGELFSEHLSIVFYYKQLWEEDKDGLIVGGWVKESLTMALPNCPILAGRLDAEDRSIVKINDARVRLVYAQACTGLNRWLEAVAPEKGNTTSERKLAYWKDVDSERPQNSPLCYVQVTNVEGEGFSIGITCSVLISNPLDLTRFVKTWSEIHRKLVAASERPSRLPLIYRPSLRKATFPNPAGFRDDFSSETAVFKISNKDAKNLAKFLQSGGHNHDPFQVLGSLCHDKAKGERFGNGAAEEVFSLVVWDKKGTKSVNMCKTHNDFTDSTKEYNDIYEGLRAVNWDFLDPFDVDFQGSNKPVNVSYIAHTHRGEGLVIIVGDQDEDGSYITLFVVVALPKLKS